MKILFLISLLICNSIVYSATMAVIDSFPIARPQLLPDGAKYLIIDPANDHFGETDTQKYIPFANLDLASMQLVANYESLNGIVNHPEVLTPAEKKKYIAQLAKASKKATKVVDSYDELDYYGLVSHGLHVSGIVHKVSPSSNILAIHGLSNSGLAYFQEKITDKLCTEKVITLKELMIYGKDISRLVSKEFFASMNDVVDQKIPVVNLSMGVTKVGIENVLHYLVNSCSNVTVDDNDIKIVSTKILAQMQSDIKKIIDRGVDTTLFVFAAGNDGMESNMENDLIASIHADNLIKVAAVDKTGKLTVFSNYSKQNVDVAAPGLYIKSIGLKGATLTMSGTSMAAPYVAGLAIKLVEENSNLTPNQIKTILMNSGTKTKELENITVSGRYL